MRASDWLHSHITSGFGCPGQVEDARISVLVLGHIRLLLLLGLRFEIDLVVDSFLHTSHLVARGWPVVQRSPSAHFAPGTQVRSWQVKSRLVGHVEISFVVLSGQQNFLSWSPGCSQRLSHMAGGCTRSLVHSSGIRIGGADLQLAQLVVYIGWGKQNAHRNLSRFQLSFLCCWFPAQQLSCWLQFVFSENNQYRNNGATKRNSQGKWKNRLSHGSLRIAVLVL